MSRDKKFSILTSSNSNNLLFYKSYINSINIQKYLPNELVFVNDGIKNRNFIHYLKLKINKKIKIKIINNYVNLGITQSLRRGINSCKNKLIMRLDIDDTWNKDHCEKLIVAYKKNKNYLIYSNVICTKYRYLNDFLILDNPTIHSSWLINRNICKNFTYEPFYPEDYATISKYYRKNFKFYFLKIKTMNYNVHQQSFSKKKIANRDMHIIRKLNFEYFKKTKKNFIDIFMLFSLIDLLRFLKNKLLMRY